MMKAIVIKYPNNLWVTLSVLPAKTVKILS